MPFIWLTEEDGIKTCKSCGYREEIAGLAYRKKESDDDPTEFICEGCIEEKKVEAEALSL